MIPEIGSEWYARDGRVMRVESVTIPDDPSKMPKARMTVLNAGRRMRRTTEMGTDNFGSELYFGFLRPRSSSNPSPTQVVVT